MVIPLRIAHYVSSTMAAQLAGRWDVEYHFSGDLQYSIQLVHQFYTKMYLSE